MTSDREQPVYEVYRKERRPDGLLFFEYRAWRSAADRDSGARPWVLNNHKAMVRETHQRRRKDAEGRWMHVSGARVRPQEEREFIANDQRAYRWQRRGLGPDGDEWENGRERRLKAFKFRDYWGREEELDPQWEREVYTWAEDEQIDRAIRRALWRFVMMGRSGDLRGTTLNLQVGAGADDGYYSDNTSTDDDYEPTIGNVFVGRQGSGDPLNSWFRWTGVSGLSGATINSATFSPFAFEFGDLGFDEDLFTSIFAEDAANPSAPTSRSDANSKTRTSASVEWDGVLADANPNDHAESPSIVSVVQELANSYDPGAIQILHDDDGSGSNTLARFRSYDEDSAQGALLDIDFTGTGEDVDYAGTSTTESSATGALSVARGVSGTSTTESSATASLQVTRGLSAKSVTESSGEGQLRRNVGLSAESVTESSATGILRRLVAMAGESRTLSSATGALQRVRELAATSLTQSSATGVLARLVSLAGTSTTQSSATATLRRLVSLAGQSATESSAEAILRLYKGLSAASSTLSSATGALVRTLGLSGTSTTLSSAEALLRRLIPLAGESTTESSATGDLEVQTPNIVTLAGTSTTRSAATGNLIRDVSLAGESATESSAEGALQRVRPLSGQSRTLSDADGALSIVVTLSGDAVTLSSAEALLRRDVALAGESVTESSATGALFEEPTEEVDHMILLREEPIAQIVVSQEPVAAILVDDAVLQVAVVDDGIAGVLVREEPVQRVRVR